MWFKTAEKADTKYILYRKFPISFALRFLENLCNILSYILHRKFHIYFVSVFSAILNHILVLYVNKKYPM